MSKASESESKEKVSIRTDFLGTFKDALNRCFPEDRLAMLTPELRAKYDEFKDAMNNRLKPLPPIEQVAGANDARYTLNTMIELFCQLVEMDRSALDQQRKMMQNNNSHESKETSVSAEIERRIAAGELMTKSSHDLAVNAAEEAVRSEIAALRDKEIAELKEQKRIREMREKKIDEAGLCRPHVSLGSVIDGTEEEFDKVVATAKERKAEFAGKFPAESDIWGRVLYASDDDLEIIKQVLGARPGAAALNKNSQSTTTTVEPLATGTGFQKNSDEKMIGTRETKSGLKFSVVC